MTLHDQAIENLVELAKEVGAGDSSVVLAKEVDLDAAYRLMAAGFLESYVKVPEDAKHLVLMGTCVHLLVENTFLYKKLLGETE